MPRATSISEGDPPFGKIMLAGSSRTSRSCHSQPAIAAQNAIRSMTLASTEVLEGGAVWLRYKLQNG